MQSKLDRRVEPELLGMDEVEAMTGRSRWSWRRDCYSGAVASVKIGRRLLLPISEVRRVIKESTRPRLGSNAKEMSEINKIASEKLGSLSVRTPGEAGGDA